MHVLRIDHATINTSDLEASLRFYEHFLGLRPGWRPALGIGGAWLYAEGGDYPILHLIARERPATTSTFDHLAFRFVGLEAYLAKVKAAKVWYTSSPVLDTPLVQVQHFDPNYVLIEVNFHGEPFPESEVAQTSMGASRPLPPT